MSKSKEQQIFEKCITMYLPIHNFRNDTRCFFYKGFKFEEATDRTGAITYNCYNIRFMRYKKLSKEELQMVLDCGIMASADILSYKNYQGIISKYTSVLDSPGNGYKSIEKAKKVIEHYEKVCSSLVRLHKKHKDLFVS